MAKSTKVQELLSNREKELRDIYAALEGRIQEKENESQELREHLASLQDDFIYNLNLLEERDKELERYETLMEGLATDIHDREVRISELRTLMEERIEESANLKSLVQSQEQQHHDAIRKLQRDKELLTQQHEDTLNACNEEFELERSNWQLQLKGCQQELELQRESFAAEFEQLRRAHEVDMRIFKQELNQQLLEAEHKVASAVAELNVIKAAKDGTEAKFQQQLELNRNLDEKLRNMQWEAADSNKHHTGRIAELEEQLRQSKSEAAVATAAFEEFCERIHLKFDEEKNSLTNSREHAEKQVNTLTAELAKVMEQLTAQRKEDGDRIRALQRQLAEKDEELHEANQHMKASAGSVQTEIKRYSDELLRRDEAILKHLEHIQKLENELDARRADITNYKEDIKRLLATEQSLQRALSEQNLEWERKVAGIEGEKLHDQDELVKYLLHAQQVAENQVKLLRSRLNGVGSASRPLSALGFENQHKRPTSTPPFFSRIASPNIPASASFGGIPDSNMVEPLLRADADQQIKMLEEQNAQLTEIIHRMREDMEVMQQAMSSGTEKHPRHVYKSINHQQQGTSNVYTPREDSAQLHAQLMRFQTLLDQKQSIIDHLLEQQQKLHQKIDESVCLSREKANGHDHDNTNTLIQELQSENDILQCQLSDAVADMQRMATERTRLVEMSNALKAEVRFWTEKNANKAEASTQTLNSSQGRQLRGKGPVAQSIPRPIKQSARITPSQKEAKERLATSRRPADGSLHHIDELSDGEKEQLLKLKLRARGVRNWNERSEDDEN